MGKKRILSALLLTVLVMCAAVAEGQNIKGVAAPTAPKPAKPTKPAERPAKPSKPTKPSKPSEPVVLPELWNDIDRRDRRGWVDLGLPSGTLWADRNEDGIYSYEEAQEVFGGSLPTKAQLEELLRFCEWYKVEGGAMVKGPNGKTITLPAAGHRPCGGSLEEVGTVGGYWSSTALDKKWAWYFYFDFERGEVQTDNRNLCYGFSVRLVSKYVPKKYVPK